MRAESMGWEGPSRPETKGEERVPAVLVVVVGKPGFRRGGWRWRLGG